MKKSLLITILFSFMLNLHAISTDELSKAGFSKLTTQEQAEIVTLIANKKQANAKTIPIEQKVDQAQKWINLGSSIGKGLASSANEVGMAVNEFAKTSVGQWTMFLIIFHVIGDTVIGIFASLLFLIVGITFTTILLNRMNPFKVKYDNDGKIVSKERQAITDDETMTWFWVGYIAIVGLSTVIMINV